MRGSAVSTAAMLLLAHPCPSDRQTGSMSSPRRVSLSKSRFCYGLQCLKQLWWRVNEPDAPELVAGPALQAVFDRGHLVGERAQREFPGGALIGHEYWEVDKKVTDTRLALGGNTPAIYEASFLEDGVFVAVDVLERNRKGHSIIEVKSSTSVKEQYIPDVAIQLHVARAAGLEVRRGEVMHLNPACRYPDLSDLFIRVDVTDKAEALLPDIPGHLKRMQHVLAGKLPVVEAGPQCEDPYECPFWARCWGSVPDDHVSNLYYGGKLAKRLLHDGVASMRDIPGGVSLSAIQTRQVRAMKTGKVAVEVGLAEALRSLKAPVAYLDFETINPAVPVWTGCGPYMAVPVQMSCHVVSARGTTTHHERLAEGPGDPRPAMADAVVGACEGARTVVAYNASFEKRCLQHLAEHVPRHRVSLDAVIGKLVDLLPIVRDYVYHPAFGGGFGMKVVGPALVPSLDYNDLEIGEGSLASTALEGLLLAGSAMAPSALRSLRGHLLAYCERDTLAMVKVVERLEALAISGC